MRQIRTDCRGISSFSLLGVMVLLLATFTVSYLSYAADIEAGYRTEAAELSKLDLRAVEICQDLENHALFIASECGTAEGFEENYSAYIDGMASEGFDVWKSGDVTGSVDGAYAAYGGTVSENYTVRLSDGPRGRFVEGSFNVTMRNHRLDVTLSRTLEFRRHVP